MFLDEVNNWEELLNGDIDHMQAAWEAEFMNIMYIREGYKTSNKENFPLFLS